MKRQSEQYFPQVDAFPYVVTPNSFFAIALSRGILCGFAIVKAVVKEVIKVSRRSL